MPYPKLTLLFIASLFLGLQGNSQTASFTTFKNEPVTDNNLLKAIEERLQKDIIAISGSNKKYISDIYKERAALLKGKLEKKEIITDPAVQQYLTALANQVFANNPQLTKDDIRIVFSRSGIPNAQSAGEGTIIFNIGLFNRLQNESQAIFVLCHELAHYYLNHSNKNIEHYVNTIYSDDFQKKLKDIKKSGFQQNTQLEQLSKSLLFKKSRHSREFEQSSDSMALELMKNTGYDLQEALNCLALLDSVDKDKYEGKIKMEDRFQFAQYPFKKSWLSAEAISFTETDKEKKEQKNLADSLKTHPDCTERIKLLTAKANSYNKAGNKKFMVNETLFNQLKSSFDYEIIEYYFKANNISKSLFYAMEMLQSFPDDAYLHAMVGKCLNGLYNNQKAHTLGLVTDLPNPNFDVEYNQLLYFIQNLRLQEIAALSYFYLAQNENKYSGDEEFVAALIESKANYNKPEEKNKWVEFYKKSFINGQYKF